MCHVVKAGTHVDWVSTLTPNSASIRGQEPYCCDLVVSRPRDLQYYEFCKFSKGMGYCHNKGNAQYMRDEWLYVLYCLSVQLYWLILSKGWAISTSYELTLCESAYYSKWCVCRQTLSNCIISKHKISTKAPTICHISPEHYCAYHPALYQVSWRKSLYHHFRRS